ncbi:MAG TPA: glycerophosphodiester phosphodiesterase [Pyrinomonadaceae bacterium]|nr:glycerophosphodiester phosphodiesterase [Pyrinomonadaceae bacterium]
MPGRRVKYLGAFAASALLALVALYGYLSHTARPASEHPYFGRGGAPRTPLVIAHRGGAGLWPENTAYAYERALALGVDVLEIDVRSTADGELVVIHDRTVERTTDGSGAVGTFKLSELKKLDAGFRWSPAGGESFPFRGRGLTVPTLREVFEAFPQARYNIEPKQENVGLAAPLCRAIREAKMTERVLVASFGADVLEEFRRECPEVATSASASEASKFLTLSTTGLEETFTPAAQALQVPEFAGGMRVLTRGFVEAAHARNLHVHAWTINDEEAMQRLLAVGVDGIMTDYPDRLLKVLGRETAPRE